MQMPSDDALARNRGVHIILGIHDHHYEDTVINNVRILNSGTDFDAYLVIGVNGSKGIRWPRYGLPQSGCENMRR